MSSRALCLALSIALSGSACANERSRTHDGPSVDAGGLVGDAATVGADAGTEPVVAEPGAACTCDSGCAGTADNPGVCVQGICMQRATADCATAGSSAECPAGSRCWGLEGVTGGICWPDCDAHDCAGACDADGSCVMTDSTTCDASCCIGGDAPPCTADSCPAGTECDPSGACIADIGTPPPGPPPSCSAGTGTVPDWRCTEGAAACGALVAFEPVTGPGYDNYPINGETTSNQYRSFVRRDVMMLVKYAAAMVDCQASTWPAGNGGPVGLGDMSEADGSIPGTSVGSPGHPAGTHEDGHDMDIGYFQTGTANNRLREVCPHTSGGAEQYHCTGDPTTLDPWRTALFIGHLHSSPQLRVIGVDGRVGPLVDSATASLCADGWLSSTACSSSRMTYETTDTGRGWFLFHLHHLHVSLSSP